MTSHKADLAKKKASLEKARKKQLEIKAHAENECVRPWAAPARRRFAFRRSGSGRATLRSPESCAAMNCAYTGACA